VQPVSLVHYVKGVPRPVLWRLIGTMPADERPSAVFDANQPLASQGSNRPADSVPVHAKPPRESFFGRQPPIGKLGFPQVTTETVGNLTPTRDLLGKL